MVARRGSRADDLTAFAGLAAEIGSLEVQSLCDAEFIEALTTLERAKAACAAAQVRLTERFVESQAEAAARLRLEAQACSDAGDFDGWVLARTGPAPWRSGQRPLWPATAAHLSISAADDALAHRSLGAGRPRPPRVPQPWRPTRERRSEPRPTPPTDPCGPVGRGGQRAPRRARGPRHEPPRPRRCAPESTPRSSAPTSILTTRRRVSARGATASSSVGCGPAPTGSTPRPPSSGAASPRPSAA